MSIISIKKVVDFKALTAEVNLRMKSDYAQNYISNVYGGSQKSGPISKCIEQILKEENSKSA
jgi:hypothetical protein